MNLNEIISRCLKNDRKAQTIFYNRYVSILGNTSYRYANSQEDAKDILQKSFVKIFISVTDKFETEDHLKNWMKRIVINTALNHQKSVARYKSHIKENAFPIQETLYKASSSHINDELLKYHLKNLKPIYYQIINLIAIDGFSHKEAGALLNIKESSSRGRYSRAISELRQKMNVELSNLSHEE